jgi:hypothetical protein
VGAGTSSVVAPPYRLSPPFVRKSSVISTRHEAIGIEASALTIYRFVAAAWPAPTRVGAAAIGIEAESLRTYRMVAASWPEPTHIGSASWSVHREMIEGGKGDTVTLKALIVEHKGRQVLLDDVRR